MGVNLPDVNASDLELAKDLQQKLALLWTEELPAGEEPDRFLNCVFAIEHEIEYISRYYKRYVTNLHVDFANDAVGIKTVAERPKKWSYNNLKTFIAGVYERLKYSGVLIYSISIDEGQPIRFGLGEFPSLRKTCYDLTQFPKSKDAALQVEHSIPATTFI